MKLIRYELKYKRFTDGVWDNKFRKTVISAENQYQAVYQHGVNVGIAYPAENIEDVIVMVHSLDGNPTLLLPGATYETLEGKKVKMVKYKDLENMGRTTYETIMDENGHHRYSRRDIGRCTGSKTNAPKNIQLGTFWQRMDIDDPYDYIMERKPEVYDEEEMYNGDDQ
ncbi:conserved hypothetical protein [Edwardsiella phage PEi26]|uniref:Uncharacterized protein n=1 Tax=Edwardsiella phage PEi26 TaxID=1608311 RepID=A0A0B6VTU4_9CAUD|nr:conserved hypothetical protein [Edwardsiella phage PEi26]